MIKIILKAQKKIGYTKAYMYSCLYKNHIKYGCSYDKSVMKKVNFYVK